MTQTAVRLPASDAAALDAEAAERNTTRSELIREAVVEHLSGRRTAAAPPVGALVASGRLRPPLRQMNLVAMRQRAEQLRGKVLPSEVALAVDREDDR